MITTVSNATPSSRPPPGCESSLTLLAFLDYLDGDSSDWTDSSAYHISVFVFVDNEAESRRNLPQEHTIEVADTLADRLVALFDGDRFLYFVEMMIATSNVLLIISGV